MTTIMTAEVAEGGKPKLLVRKARLTVTEGADKGQQCNFAGRAVIMGTRPGCQLALSDATVSRHHCELKLHGGAAFLRDLDSSNGTYINGVRIVEAYLEPGDMISLGETRIRFEVGDAQESIDLSDRQSFGPVLGRSVAMREIFALLEKVSPTDATVLVQGETGTGKDLVATAIHEASRRAKGPFVVVDCAAMPSNLMEDELFGHERGAYTGATGSRSGAFELAHGGSLFLDEIGELSLELQPKLLRVLESRTVRRLGSAETRKVDVRLIAATNRELQREVNRNTFREDLFFRLNVIRIDLPPLRERTEDISMLARFCVRRLLGRLPDASVEDFLPRPARELLKTYPWPGNVRELHNHIQRVVALSDPSLQPGFGRAQPVPGDAPAEPARPEIALELPFRAAKEQWVDRFEKTYLTELLSRSGGNISKAARRGQMDRAYLYKLLRKHGLLERPS